jgi:hemolysin III
MFIPDWFRNDKPLLGWIVGGGIVYTLGMIPFVKDTKGMHFIWHIFVMLGAALHWFGMYLYVY